MVEQWNGCCSCHSEKLQCWVVDTLLDTWQIQIEDLSEVDRDHDTYSWIRANIPADSHTTRKRAWRVEATLIYSTLMQTVGLTPVGLSQFLGQRDARIYFIAACRLQWSTVLIDIHCVSKIIPDVFSYNSRKRRRIFIIFGRNITEKVSNQKMLVFSTSPPQNGPQ